MSFENIDNSLEIESVPISKEIIKREEKDLSQLNQALDQIKKDHEYARSNIYSLVEKGQEALNGALELAQESDSPRAYEVVAQLIKSVGDTADKLMDLQQKKKDLEKEDKSSSPTSVTNNAVFFGSTAELQKFLKNSMNQDQSK